MLKGLSEQVADCLRRAAECKELAALATNPSDQEFYLEREQAWLKLMRSYELSERVGLLVQELTRRKRSRTWPFKRTAVAAPKLPNCPACHIEMSLYAVRPMYLTVGIKFERAFFHCENCGCLVDHLSAKPRE
jgi:hypothetical protein